MKETGADDLAKGLDTIADRLDELVPDVAPIVARARRLAPVASGNLARSIRGADGTVGTPVRYGLPVHFGVPSRGQTPRPFLFQAVDAEKNRIVDTYARDVQALIAREV